MHKPLINTTLNLTSTTKFLDTYDNEFSWETHIDYLSKKLNNAYYAILHLRNTLSEETLLNVYYALAYSHISLSILLWGKSSEATRIFI